MDFLSVTTYSKLDKPRKMMSRLFALLSLEKWHTDRTGFGLSLFRVGKAIGMGARFLFVVALLMATVGSIVDPSILFAVSFGAGPVLLCLGLAEAVARYLMRMGGAQQ